MERLIYTFGQYLRRKYPFKVRKIGLDAGFTCPNRDGTKAVGGCVYCDNRSFSVNADTAKSLPQQIEEGMAAGRAKSIDRFIAYFQAYTNTYAPITRLKEIYDVALRYPEIVGISVGTRPDCLSKGVLDLLESYAPRLDVWLEIGLETSHDRTLTWLNRAHTWAEFEDAARRTEGRGFQRVVHLIYGLPGESHPEMMATTDRVAALGFNGAKVHHLYVARGTPLETMNVRLFSFEEWVPLAADVVERLPETMYLQRLAGELGNEYLVAPRWGKSAGDVVRAVEAELARRGTKQGSRCLSSAALSKIASGTRSA